MTKTQKLQNELAYNHIKQLSETAKRLRGRRINKQSRSLDLSKSLKIAKRYHRIYGFN